MVLPPLIHTYLLNRGITPEVIDRNNIGWSNDRLVIPVYDRDRSFKFNKYRRSPLADAGPKYTYDRGATTALYHAAELSHPFPLVIICEGELDALVLESHGFVAVSSTGGALSFKKEWASLFDGKKIYICMDNDPAGVEGACMIQAMLPQASIVNLPLGLGEKDVTDFFAHGRSIAAFAEALSKAVQFPMPQDLDWVSTTPITKKAAREKVLEFKAFVLKLVDMRRAFDNELRPSPHIQHLIDYANERVEFYNSFLNNKPVPHIFGDDKKAHALRVPMTNFIPFNMQGFGVCQWHTDTTPSLKYYKKDNHAFCFSCRKYADVIDVVMQLRNISFKEAIDFLVP